MKAPQAPPGRWARDRRLRAALAVVAAVALWSAPSAFASRDGADFATSPSSSNGGPLDAPVWACTPCSEDDDDSIADGVASLDVAPLDLEPAYAGEAPGRVDPFAGPVGRSIRHRGRAPPGPSFLPHQRVAEAATLARIELRIPSS